MAIEDDDFSSVGSVEDARHDPGLSEAHHVIYCHPLRRLRKKYHRNDLRTRLLRNQTAQASWDAQALDLYNAYLEWRAGISVAKPTTMNEYVFTVTAVNITGKFFC
jgi:hypothetical protein